MKKLGSGALILITISLCAKLCLLKKTSSAFEESVYLAAKRAEIHQPGESPFVIMTAANYPYRFFVLNLFCSMNRHKGRRLLLISMDIQMHEYAQSVGIDSVYYNTTRSTSNMEAHGTEEFKRLVVVKLFAVRAVMRAGFNTFFVDSDTSWCSDPVEATREARTTTTNNFVFQRTTTPRQFINSGIYYARNNPRTLRFMDSMIDQNPKNGDQAMFNTKLCLQKKAKVIYTQTEDERVGDWEDYPSECRWRGHATTAFLSDRKFAIGCTRFDGEKLSNLEPAFVRNLCAKEGLALLHVSCWQKDDKMNALKDRGLWFANEAENRCEESAVI